MIIFLYGLKSSLIKDRVIETTHIFVTNKIGGTVEIFKADAPWDRPECPS